MILMTSFCADGVHVNNARVVVGDVAAANGVMHIIDMVLIPPQYATGHIVGK
jgi:uncharacterized surface protein with fasciclin (FAS1) repeats